MNDTSTKPTSPAEPAGHPPAASNRSNPVLWLVVGLPLLAVAASFASLTLAVTRGDKELPADYHWEGSGLASDEARIAAAARMGLSARLQVDSVGERCSVQLAGAGPASLRLQLTHPTEPGADRQLLLQPAATGSGRYEAPCPALAPAHWWVQVSDAEGRWLLRGRATGALDAGLLLSPTAPARAASAPGDAQASAGQAGQAGP